ENQQGMRGRAAESKGLSARGEVGEEKEKGSLNHRCAVGVLKMMPLKSGGFVLSQLVFGDAQWQSTCSNASCQRISLIPFLRRLLIAPTSPLAGRWRISPRRSTTRTETSSRIFRQLGSMP